jgi:hypothetical protein
MVQLGQERHCRQGMAGILLMRRCTVLAATAFPSSEADCSHR